MLQRIVPLADRQCGAEETNGNFQGSSPKYYLLRIRSSRITHHASVLKHLVRWYNSSYYPLRPQRMSGIEPLPDQSRAQPTD